MWGNCEWRGRGCVDGGKGMNAGVALARECAGWLREWQKNASEISKYQDFCDSGC